MCNLLFVMLNMKVIFSCSSALSTLEMLVTGIDGQDDFACRSFTLKHKWMTVPAVDELVASESNICAA